MISATLKRLTALEARSPQRKRDARRDEEKLISDSGMSLAEIVSAYGSLPEYAYYLMTKRDSPSKPLPPEYASHAEHYLAMVRGEA